MLHRHPWYLREGTRKMAPTDTVMEGGAVMTTRPIQPTTTGHTASIPTLRVGSRTVPRNRNRAPCAHRDLQAQARDMDALLMAILPVECRRSRDQEHVCKTP